MKTFTQIKNQAKKIFNNCKNLAENNGYVASAESIEKIIKEFDGKEMTVVVAGELKRGKSSMLNALIGEENLFPVNANVATNAVTVVRYGETEQIEVLVTDNNCENGIRTKIIERSKISEYVSEQGNPENYKKVQRLDIRIPNEKLKNGLVLVDTPGVGSLNIAHAETTYAFLPQADLLLFTTDSMSGMTETEIAFLKRGYDLCKRIVFPITKKDLNPDYAVIAEDNREKISKALGIAQSDVNIIPISSTAKLRYLHTGKESMYTNSGFKELEEIINDTVDNSRVDVFITPFLARCENELIRITDDVVAQTAVFNSEKEKVEKLIAALEEEAERVKKLRESGTDWKNNVHLDIMKLKSETQSRITELRSELEFFLESECEKYDVSLIDESVYSAILSDINGTVVRGFMNIKADILEEKSNGIINEINKNLELDVNLNRSIFETMDFVPKDNVKVEFPKQKLMNVVSKKGREISMKTMGMSVAGGILGAVAGFFIAGPVGASGGFMAGQAIGSLAGMSTGAINAIKTGSKDPIIVRRELAKHINATLAEMNSILSISTMEIENEIVKSFNQQLKDRENDARDNIEKNKKNISMLAADRKMKQKELDTLKKSLENILKSICDFADEVTNNGILPTDAESDKKDENISSDNGYNFL